MVGACLPSHGTARSQRRCKDAACVSKSASKGDCFEAMNSLGQTTAPGRFEPAGPRRTGRSLSAVAQYEHVGQLSNALLTLIVALAAGLDVGLMALTRRTPSGGDRLLTLQCRRPRFLGVGAQRVTLTR